MQFRESRWQRFACNCQYAAELRVGGAIAMSVLVVPIQSGMNPAE